jgi:hypothetical protein
VRIDTAHQKITVTRADGEESFSFDPIRRWRGKTVPYLYGVNVNSNSVQYVVVEDLT